MECYSREGGDGQDAGKTEQSKLRKDMRGRASPQPQGLRGKPAMWFIRLSCLCRNPSSLDLLA